MEIEVGDVEEDLLITVDKIVEQVAESLKDNLNITVPRDTGELADSIRLWRRGKGKYIVGLTLPYARPQEFGTKPFTPPIEPLKEWSRRNLDTESDAWKVRSKIQKEGLDEKRYFREAIDRVRDEYG